MKRDNSAAALTKKRQAWIERTQAILGLPRSEIIELLSTSRTQSIRVNTLRLKSFDKRPAWLGEQYSWMKEGFMLNASVKEIRDDPYIVSGKAFVQNAASWLPVLALDPKAGESILDVCAAPGGKASHIAAITDNKACIWANDNFATTARKTASRYETSRSYTQKIHAL